MKRYLAIIFCSITSVCFSQVQTAPAYKGPLDQNVSIPAVYGGKNYKITADNLATKTNSVFKGTLSEARAGADGYNTAIISDYSGGTFYYDANDHATADNTGTVFVTPSGKRFKRIYDNYILPDWFGAYGDSLDHVAALQNLFNSDINGKTIRFGSGIYIVANDSVTLMIRQKKNVKVLGNGGTTFSNLAGKGGIVGGNIIFDTCENIEFSGIRTFDLNKTRWSSFNNLLEFTACKNVKVHDNYFGSITNKHIHLGGSDENIEIYGNVFENAGYNVNPLTQNTFASIFLYIEGTATQRLNNISIHDNKFKNNSFFCVSANNYNIAANNGFDNVFSGISIQNNSVDSCGGAFIVRVNGAKVIGNVISNTGFTNLLRTYVYVDSLQRYYSNTRLNYSPLPVSSSNTTTPISGAAIITTEAVNATIRDNVFRGGLVSQNVTLTGVVQPCAYIIGGSNKRNIIIGNTFADTVNGASWIPHIVFNNTPTGLDLETNSFLLPAAYAGTYVVKVSNGGANRAFVNRAKQKSGTSEVDYAGTFYNSITPVSESELDPVYLGDKANIVSGANASKTTSVDTDVHDVIGSGFCYGNSGSLNRINGQNTFFIHCNYSAANNNYCLNVAANIAADNRLFYEKKINGTWQGVTELQNKADIKSVGATITANASNTTFTVTHSFGSTGYEVGDLLPTNANAAAALAIPHYVINKTSTTMDVVFTTAPASGSITFDFIMHKN